MKIIDISSHNAGSFDWQKIKSSVGGVIIRCGYRGYSSGKIVKDKRADEYAEACVANGIPFGLYFMSQAITEAEGREEAEYTIAFAKKYGAKLPLIIDSEDGDGTAKVVRADGLSKPVRTDVCKAFCEAVNAAGFVGGVYASESWFTSRLNYDELKHFFMWVANYGKNTGEKTSTVKLQKCDMHQYTSRAHIDGIPGNVDMSDGYTISTGSSTEQTIPKESGEYKMPTIKRGSKGTAVKVWQVIVGVTPDGDFGAKTEAATVAWQKKHMGEKEADGVVGAKTWKAGLESL